MLGGAVGASGGVRSGFWVQASGPVDETGQSANTQTGDVARSWSASIYNGARGPNQFEVLAICARDSAAPTAEALCADKPATIVGTADAETLRGTPAADVIAGLGGNDTIAGLAGNDSLCGGAGKDRLLGGPGNDTLVGGPGQDTLKGGPGKNTVRQ